MRIEADRGATAVTYRLHPDPDVVGAPPLLAETFRLDPGRATALPHADLEAVLLLTVAWPWLAGALRVPRPVSAGLAGLAAGHGVQLGPVDPGLDPRPPGPRLGIGASGGVDSVAAAELLGRHHPHVHLRHVDHPGVTNRADHQELAAVEAAVRTICGDERPLDVVRTDLAFLRGHRPTFPTWAAVAAPLLLLADDLGLGGVVLGSVLGARFLRNGDGFRAAPAHPWWFDLLAHAGVPLVRPTTALTEVSTQRIVDAGPFAEVTRSCLRGTDGDCGRCPKCLRKGVVRAGLRGEPLPDAAALAELPELRRYLARPTVPMSHVWTWGLATVPGLASGPLGALLAPAARPGVPTGWVTRAYLDGLDVEVPDPWRGTAADGLARLGCTPMTPADLRDLTSW